jgi:hypothetical protein
MAGVLATVVGIAAFVSLAGQQFGPATIKSLACSPQPCLNLQDYTLWVSNVVESNGVLRMQASFRNSSNATHADPVDLELLDAQRQPWPAIQDASGCTAWSRTEFSNGARYGPVTMCFRPASLASPLMLRWSPDMGLICCQADLDLSKLVKR